MHFEKGQEGNPTLTRCGFRVVKQILCAGEVGVSGYPPVGGRGLTCCDALSHVSAMSGVPPDFAPFGPEQHLLSDMTPNRAALAACGQDRSRALIELIRIGVSCRSGALGSAARHGGREL
jgi:hypothetical protein